MLPVEKKAAAEIVKKFDNNAWGIESRRELMTALKVNLYDITSFATYHISRELDNPTHVDRGIVYEKNPSYRRSKAEDARIVEMVESNRARPTVDCQLWNVDLLD